MKLRFDPNRLRLRLAPDEIERLRDEGHLEQRVWLSSEARLTYRVELDPACKTVEGSLAGDEDASELELKLSPDLATRVLEGDVLEGEVSVGSGESLSIFVERDLERHPKK